jgi:hypothetical protein
MPLIPSDRASHRRGPSEQHSPRVHKNEEVLVLSHRLGAAIVVGVRHLSALAAVFLAALAVAPPAPAARLPSLPHGWPATLRIGLTDAPGGAHALRRSAPFGFRYQYLAGGVNTGQGWSGWNPDGTFVSRYVAESRAAHVIPVFSYYQLLQSKPGAGGGEAAADLANLKNPDTMGAWWADLQRFFRRAHGSSPVVLHVEPDLWGYVEQAAAGPSLSADDDGGLFRSLVRAYARTGALKLPRGS